MKLCLVAPAALDETEAWCRESFKHVLRESFAQVRHVEQTQGNGASIT